MSAFQDYNVGDVDPTLPAKRKKARIGNAELSDADADDMEEQHDEESGARALKVARKEAAQSTPDELKEFMPFHCERPGIGILKDVIQFQRFVAKYDHRKQEDFLDPHKVQSLPKQFQKFSHDGKFGASATDDDMNRALEKALAWAWGKHKHLWGEDRPAHTVVWSP